MPLFFFSFTVKHPRTVGDLDGLNALSDTIALYHNNDSIENLTLHGPRGTQTAAPPAYPDNHYADRVPSPLLPQALMGMSLSRQTNAGTGVNP